MSKYVERIMDEVYDTFANHYKENDEKVDFLSELIEELNDELIKLDGDGGCGICPKGECDCEPEVCI